MVSESPKGNAGADEFAAQAMFTDLARSFERTALAALSNALTLQRGATCL
jgi:hypothetical protein